MPTAKYTIDIVIPTYLKVEMMERCIKSLTTITIPHNITNIWVVENGGKYGVEDLVARYQNQLPLQYLYLEQGNLSLARNCGLEHSSADALIFFDNDMRFTQSTIDSYASAIEQHGDSYFYGGALDPDYQKAPEEWLNDFLPASAKGFSLGTQIKEVEQPDFLGGNHAIFRQHLIAYNGYDTNCANGQNQGLVGEETRLQEKLLAAGIKGLYLPDAKVLHYVPVENCSVDWILQRAYRQGLTLAYQEKPRITKNKLFGIPYYHLVKFFKLLIKRCINPFSGKAKTLKFADNFKFHVQKGVIAGYLESNTK